MLTTIFLPWILWIPWSRYDVKTSSIIMIYRVWSHNSNIYMYFWDMWHTNPALECGPNGTLPPAGWSNKETILLLAHYCWCIKGNVWIATPSPYLFAPPIDDQSPWLYALNFGQLTSCRSQPPFSSSCNIWRVNSFTRGTTLKRVARLGQGSHYFLSWLIYLDTLRFCHDS